MEEAAKFAGLNFVIECLVNLWGDTAALFAGAETEAHEAAVQGSPAPLPNPQGGE